FFFMLPSPPSSTLFPYTTLFRSDGKVDVLATDADSALPNVNEAIFIGIHQRAQEHAAHQAEDGGVGADSQCQRQHHSDRQPFGADRKSTRLNSSHVSISYAVFCL